MPKSKATKVQGITGLGVSRIKPLPARSSGNPATSRPRLPRAFRQIREESKAREIIDFRHIRPSNRREIGLVADALLPTRIDFHQILGSEAPETPEHECYAIRHNMIQTGAWKFWFLGGEPPLLYSLNSYTGGFDKWRGADLI